MKEVGKIWMNGKLVPFKNAKVHVLTHALHYSTAVFEGIRCYNTPNGSAIFRLPEHVDRFFNSAKLYGMKIRYTKKQIIDAIIKTVKASGLKECYIKNEPIGIIGIIKPFANRYSASFIGSYQFDIGKEDSTDIYTIKSSLSWVYDKHIQIQPNVGVSFNDNHSEPDYSVGLGVVYLGGW